MADDPQFLSALINARRSRVIDAARKAEQESIALSKLAAHWPDRMVSNIYYSNAFRELGEVSVTAKVETRELALHYFDAFQLLPITYFKGHGFSTIRVTEWVSEKKIEKYDTEVSDIYPMYWRSTFSDKATLNAFTAFNGLRVAIKVEIGNDPANRTVKRRTTHGEAYLAECILHNAPGGSVIKYGSGSDDIPGEVQVYFDHEAGGAAPTPRDFMVDPDRWQNVVYRR